MKAVKVNAVDMSGRLNAEGKYSMKVSGYDGYDNIHKDYILDLSNLNIDQIGVIAGFLDAVFDECALLRVTGASIVKEKEEFHCGFEESSGHAYNCNDCPNKCEEWYQWDKEMKNGNND